jgi:hypothetical protein
MRNCDGSPQKLDICNNHAISGEIGRLQLWSRAVVIVMAGRAVTITTAHAYRPMSLAMMVFITSVVPP